MPALLERLSVLHPDATSDRQRLHATLGVARFVHLSRDDKVAQAVSLVIAAQTGLWHRHADGTLREGREPAEAARYDFDLIAAELTMLQSEERGWARWFSAQSVTPFRLTYETLSSDPIGSTRLVLDHLGLSFVDVPTVGTAQLATSLNADWVERFEAERATHRP